MRRPRHFTPTISPLDRRDVPSVTVVMAVPITMPWAAEPVQVWAIDADPTEALAVPATDAF
jgi:hypothetical protein